MIDSYQQLFNSIPEIERELEIRMHENIPRKIFMQNDVEIKYQLTNS